VTLPPVTCSICSPKCNDMNNKEEELCLLVYMSPPVPWIAGGRKLAEDLGMRDMGWPGNEGYGVAWE